MMWGAIRLSRTVARAVVIGTVSVTAGCIQLRDGSSPITLNQGTGARVRRANTRITPVDRVVVQYEQRLRETASFEKLFKYFSSLVVSGRDLMTPLDMVRAITPGVPPSPISKPINIPLFESDPEDLKWQLDAMEVPEFFKFGSSEDLGLISYGRFLIFVTLLSIPTEQLSVAYHMSCGRNFKHPELRADGLRSSNVDFILSRHIKTRDHGYQAAHHSKTSILRHLFGPNLDKTLTFEEFKTFHSNLHREVLKLEYYLLSDKEDGMSLVGFTKAVAALLPSEYRGEFEERAENLKRIEVPPQWLIHKEPLIGEEYDPPLETLKGRTAEDCRVTFEDYGAWKEVLKQVEHMEQAVRMYQHRDGHFTPSGLMRAAKAVANVDLTKAQVWALFQLFDKNADEKLEHDDFVRLLIPHSVLQGKLPGPEGLGLDLLFSCCAQCVKDWYDGTMPVDEETLVED